MPPPRWRRGRPSRRRRRRRKHLVSETSRALILREIGIDPQAAQEAYWYDREARQNRAARKDALARFWRASRSYQ